MARIGAAQAAGYETDPLIMVRRIWDAHKTADEDRIRMLVRRELGVEGHPAEAFVNYCTTNCIARIKNADNVVAIVPKPKPRYTPPEVIAEHKASGEVAARKIMERTKQRLYMEMLIDGKALGDCKIDDLCSTSDFIAAIALEMPSSDVTVRETLTEAQIAAIYRTTFKHA